MRGRARIRGLMGTALVLASLAAHFLPADSSARALMFRVRYRSEQTVYLEGGSSSGLAVGDRLEVWREDRRIGEIEVAFVAGYSASCRIVNEDLVVGEGDQARIAGSGEGLPMVSKVARNPVAAPSTLQQAVEPRYSSTSASRRTTRIGGVLSVDFESFTDDTGNDLDYDRLNAYVSFRGTDLGGIPLSLKVRARAQEIDRARDLSGGIEASESRDRLYEVSLRYDGGNDRYSIMGGRLGANPFISIGYLDGLLAQVRAYKSFSVGGFFGTVPEIADLGFDSFGQKAGAYMRFQSRGGGPQTFDVVLGGVQEDGEEDVSREYALLETYYHSGGVWSLFQRAEIDFNNDWREELAEETTQLSNFALSARARISDTSRLVISYDQFKPYRTEESRFVPEELFDSLLRQGLRLRYQFQRPGQLGWHASVGWRDQEEREDSALSLGIGARHPDVGAGISVSGDLLGYSNLYTEGGVLRLRGAKHFRQGHEIYLDLGGRMDTVKDFGDDETTDTWARLGFWVELPAGLFVRGEFEFAAGDSLEGTRTSIGLGYRF